MAVREAHGHIQFDAEYDGNTPGNRTEKALSRRSSYFDGTSTLNRRKIINKYMVFVLHDDNNSFMISFE